jgi:hypothetical protein
MSKNLHRLVRLRQRLVHLAAKQLFRHDQKSKRGEEQSDQTNNR